MNAWGALKQAVKDAPAGKTIKINGTIQASSASGNNGEIEITKNLTIEAKSGTATLDANNMHRIFKVIGGTLTLNSMRLEKGSFADSVEQLDCVGAGIYIQISGKAVLNNTILENCDPARLAYGGGIRVENTSPDACTIKGSTKLVIDTTAQGLNNNLITLAIGATVKVEGISSGSDFIARFYPNTDGDQAITGDVASTFKRFLVRPTTGYRVIDNAGRFSTPNASSIDTYLNQSVIKIYKVFLESRNAYDLNNRVVFFKTNQNAYGYMYITDTNETDNGGKGYITFNFKVYNSNGSVKLQRSAVTVHGNKFYDLDTATIHDSMQSADDFRVEPKSAYSPILIGDKNNAIFYKF